MLTSMRSGPSTRGVEYAVAHELGWLDEVRVDVYYAEPDLAIPRAPGEPLEHIVPGRSSAFVPSSLESRLENSSCSSWQSSNASMWGKRLL